MYLLLVPDPTAAAIAAALFFIATITDFLDGYIARSYGSGTTLGKFLDPLADKVVGHIGAHHAGGDATVAAGTGLDGGDISDPRDHGDGLRAIAAAEGLVMAAEELGKYKMALQAIAIQGLLIRFTYFHIDFFAAGMFVLWIAMGLSVWSGVDYYVRAIRMFRPEPQAVPHKRAAV